MDHDDSSPQQKRETLLTIMLTGAGGAFFLFFLIFVSGGFFFYALLVVGVLAVFGLGHYVLWGRLLSEQTAGESEEERLREQAEEDGWPLPDTHRPRHL